MKYIQKTAPPAFLPTSFFVVLLAVFFLPSSARSQPDNSKVTIENLTVINTKHLEFSPVYYENGIVYVTSQAESAKKDDSIDEPFFELYYSELNPDGLPILAEGFSANINTPLHEGPVAFSQDYGQVFFTRNSVIDGAPQKNKNGDILMKIFTGEKGATDWENVREMPFNSNSYSCIHPTLSPDGSKLYFASNRKGGMGGYDLYVVEKVDDMWGRPKNLGPQINTTKDEAFPQLYGAKTLFFASNGQAGLGGYDLFFVNFDEAPKSPLLAYNLGAPFNSSADDLGLVLHPNGKEGFFSSARKGGMGKDDIYRFTAPDGIPGVSEIEKPEAQIFVMGQEDMQPMADVEIRVFEKGEDGLIKGNGYYDIVLVSGNEAEKEMKLVRRPVGEMEAPDMLTNPDGKAAIELDWDKEYVIIAAKKGYRPEEITLSTSGAVDKQEVNIGLNKMSEPLVVEEPPIEKGSILVLDKIYYDFNKSAIRRGAAQDLEAFSQLMFEYPEMEIELSAHTDSRGTKEYNQTLSQMRAESAKRFLVARGIDPARIRAIGFGETRPRNHCVDGVVCSETEHQYNRRTEILVTKVGLPVEVEYIDNQPERIDEAPGKGKRN